jgi:Signal peptidase, peptidase S26
MESGDRLEIETLLARWRDGCAFSRDIAAELEAHLRDATAAGLTRGLSPDQAFREAQTQLGEAAELRSEFTKVEQPRTSKPMKTSLLKSPRLRRIARNVIVTIAVVLTLRTFVLTPYRAVGASVAPEIPAGSRVLAWKIAPRFSPGDVAVYREGDHAYLGRVTGVKAEGISIVRNNQPEQTIAHDLVIGRVIAATR